jgi:hypothetical protein
MSTEKNRSKEFAQSFVLIFILYHKGHRVLNSDAFFEWLLVPIKVRA